MKGCHFYTTTAIPAIFSTPSGAQTSSAKLFGSRVAGAQPSFHNEWSAYFDCPIGHKYFHHLFVFVSLLGMIIQSTAILFFNVFLDSFIHLLIFLEGGGLIKGFPGAKASNSTSFPAESSGQLRFPRNKCLGGRGR